MTTPLHQFAVAGLLLTACHSGQIPDPVAPSPAWGNLESGPYQVGLSVLLLRDTTRPGLALDSTSIPPPGRPMQIVVWYPAATATGGAMTLRQYLELGAGALGPEAATAERRRQLVDDFTAEPLAHGIAQSALDSVLGLPMRAIQGAPRGKGRFPLVVFLHSPVWGASVMSEYLASRGFVVAAVESKGARQAPYRLSRENLDAMVLDAAFVVARMRREPYVNQRLGIVGMSNGSIAAMALQLSGPVPEAVVSLDGGIGEGAGGTYLGERSQGVPTRFTVPLLHLYSPDNPHLDFQYLRSYQASERLLVEVDHLRHRDFLAGGALERLMPGAFGEAPPQASLGFEIVCRYTAQFLEWRLADNEQAGAYLAAPPEAHGVPPAFLNIERLPALAGPGQSGDRESGRAYRLPH